MYRDKRSKMVVGAINCILNQNASAPNAAVYPGMNSMIIRILEKRGIGVLQMPCPEMICIDLPRSRPEGSSIRDVLDTPKGRRCCRQLSIRVAEQIQEFVENGFEVLAILGGDVDSPGCAVHLSEDDEKELLEGSGVFMEELYAELAERNIEIPFRGIRDSDPHKLAEDVEWLENLTSE